MFAFAGTVDGSSTRDEDGAAGGGGGRVRDDQALLNIETVTHFVERAVPLVDVRQKQSGARDAAAQVLAEIPAPELARLIKQCAAGNLPEVDERTCQHVAPTRRALFSSASRLIV